MPGALREGSGRRTQAERRAATRASLTHSALETLAAAGYSATTVAGVAARAGVSVGAALHYFPQKVDLAVAALEDGLALAVTILRKRVTVARDNPDRDVLMLDALFEMFSGSVYQAFLAVQVQARTDPAMYPRLVSLNERSIGELTRSVVEGCGPEMAEAAELPVLMDLIVATIRGIVMIDPVDPLEPHDLRIWEKARGWFCGEIDLIRQQNRPGPGCRAAKRPADKPECPTVLTV